MNSGPPRIDETEIADLKSRNALSDVMAGCGVHGKGAGPVKWALCCFHGEKTASLKIDDRQGRYTCFGCGASGDQIEFLKEYAGKSFHEAVEYLGGVRPILTVEERAEIDRKRAELDRAEKERSQRNRSAAQELFERAKPIEGTHAAAYLEARCLPVVPSWTGDLRFVGDLPYRGYESAQAKDTAELSRYPAMIAAIRDVNGHVIGAHRTYLDPQEPVKLSPPGDPSRNKAKKILGEQRGGLIRLSPVKRHMAIGEGIETTRAWFILGMAGDEDIGIAAAVSLGNLSGGSVGMSEHPVDPNKRVPSGEPDMERPGVVLPAEVENITLIGDGDSDPHMTRARLLVAARRFHRQGNGVFVSMAPDNKDFCDLLGDGE